MTDVGTISSICIGGSSSASSSSASSGGSGRSGAGGLEVSLSAALRGVIGISRWW